MGWKFWGWEKLKMASTDCGVSVERCITVVGVLHSYFYFIHQSRRRRRTIQNQWSKEMATTGCQIELLISLNVLTSSLNLRRISESILLHSQHPTKIVNLSAGTNRGMCRCVSSVCPVSFGTIGHDTTVSSNHPLVLDHLCGWDRKA